MRNKHQLNWVKKENELVSLECYLLTKLQIRNIESNRCKSIYTQQNPNEIIYRISHLEVTLLIFYDKLEFNPSTIYIFRSSKLGVFAYWINSRSTNICKSKHNAKMNYQVEYVNKNSSKIFLLSSFFSSSNSQTHKFIHCAPEFQNGKKRKEKKKFLKFSSIVVLLSFFRR